MGQIKQKKVVKITLVDDTEATKTIIVDNPKDGLTMSSIRSAFASPISDGWLLNYTGSGGAIVSVASAEYEETTTTQID